MSDRPAHAVETGQGAASSGQGAAQLPGAHFGPAQVVPGKFVVLLEPDSDVRGIARAIEAITGGEIGEVYTTALQGFSIDVPPGISMALLKAANPAVTLVEPVYVATLTPRCDPWPDCKGGGGGGGGGGPTANNDTGSVDPGFSTSIAVLDNDSGRKLSLLRLCNSLTGENCGGAATSLNTAKGQADISGKLVNYTADPGTSGTDEFFYTMKDKDGNEKSAQVTVTINTPTPNIPPVSSDDNYSTDENVTLNESAPGVLTNDDDGEGGGNGGLTAVLDTGPSHAQSFTLHADGSFDYMPTTDYDGPDSFTYRANDGEDDGNIATASITVNPASGGGNPVADDDSAATDQGTRVTIDVLGNDSGDGALSSVIDSDPSNGAAVANSDGSITYTPDYDFTGEDSFTYVAKAGSKQSAPATVTVDVGVDGGSQTIEPGMRRIGAYPYPEELDCGFVGIGIIDSGVDNHPDLNIHWREGFAGTGESDTIGHGTHVAGIAAAMNNEIGTVGVCPGGAIVSMKVTQNSGAIFSSDLIEALDWAAANPQAVHVVNMSLIFSGACVSSLRTAIAGVVNKGIPVIAAAGNSNKDIYGSESTQNNPHGTNQIATYGDCNDNPPAAYPVSTTVGAMVDYDGEPGGSDNSNLQGYGCWNGSCLVIRDRYDDTFAFFSNHNHVPDGDVSNFVNPSPGGGIDLAAPGGVPVRSTFDGGGYASLDGTSMAAPHVTGAFARHMVLHYYPFNPAGRNAAFVEDLRQHAIDGAESQFDWRNSAPPNSNWQAGVTEKADDCASRPDTDDPDCYFEPLIDVQAIDEPM